MNVVATAVAADCAFVARGASFRSKELTELIVEGIQQPGFSFIDAFSPCTAFNNTTQSWKDAVHQVPAEHDQSDRASAFAAALDDENTRGVSIRQDLVDLAALQRDFITLVSEANYELLTGRASSH